MLYSCNQQVSREWKDLSSAASLWQAAGINKRKLFSDGPMSLFSIPRLSSIKHFDLSDAWIKKSDFENILLHLVLSNHELEYLDLSHTDLSETDVDLVTRAVCRAKTVKLLWVSGLENILQCLKVTGRLKQLYLNGFLNEIPTNLFIETLSQIENIIFEDTTMVTREQMSGLVEKSKITGSKISTNMIGSFIPETLMFRDLHKTRFCLEEFNDLSSVGWSSVLETMGGSSSRLRQLELDGAFEGINLTCVNAEVVSRAFTRLTHIKLSDVRMTDKQWTMILQSNTTPNISLRMVNLSSVDPVTLSSGLSSCHSLSLDYTALSQHQWDSLLLACTSSRIRIIAFTNVDLSKVPSTILGDLMLKCTDVDLSNSNLTEEQLQTIFESILKTNDMKYLNLTNINLSKLKPQCLAQAIIRVTKVCLKKSKMTPHQLTALMVSNLGRSLLRILDLSYVNISGVETDLLSMSLSRLKEVNLLCSLLTKDQVTRLVDQMQKFTRLECLKIQSTSTNLLSHDMKQRLKKSLRFEDEITNSRSM